MMSINVGQLTDDLVAAQARRDLDGQIAAALGLLSAAQQTGMKAAEVESLRILANLFQEQSFIDKAHLYRLAAAEIAADPASGCPDDVLMALEGDLGRTCIETRDWSAAEAHTLRALEFASALGDEALVLQVNLGLILANTDRVDRARQLAVRVVERASATGNHYVLALQHLNLAAMHLDARQLNDTLGAARRAQAHADLCGNEAIRTRARQLVGQAYYYGQITGDPRYSAEAERYLQDTVRRGRENGDPALEAQTHGRLGQLFERQGRHDLAQEQYRLEMAALERLRQRMSFDEFSLSFFGRTSAYGHATAYFLRRGDPEEAFVTAERSRSRLLLALVGDQARQRAWAPGQRAELRATLDAYMAAVLDAYAAPLDADERSGRGVWAVASDDEEPSLGPAVKQAQARFVELYDARPLRAHRRTSSKLAGPAGLRAAQAWLGPDDALLAYLVTADELVIFAATDRRSGFQHLPYPGAKLAAHVRDACAALQVFDDAPWDPLRGRRAAGADERAERLDAGLRRLFALLVAPALSLVADRAHWIVVPHGPLHRVPWAALRSSAGHLVAERSVSYLPSASVGTALAARPEGRPSGALLLADPDADDPGWRLPGAHREVQAVGRVFPAAARIVGAQATKEALSLAAPSAGLLHLACHYLFDTQVPLLSFLKLAGADALYAFEIGELALGAELVTLSACATGRSGIAAGDEQLGMVASFVAAGASAVMSTLWPIDDESAADLFADFYPRALQVGLAEALAQVQRRFLAHPAYHEPCYWAPYVLTGRWRSPLRVSSETR